MSEQVGTVIASNFGSNLKKTKALFFSFETDQAVLKTLGHHKKF